MKNHVFQILDGNLATSNKQTQIHHKFLQKKKKKSISAFLPSALALEGFLFPLASGNSPQA